MRRAIGLVVLALCLLLPAAGWSQINYYPASGSGAVTAVDSEVTAVATSGTALEALHTVTMPANSLARVGDFVVIETVWQTAANGNSKTFRHYNASIAGTTLASAATTANNNAISLRTVCRRNGATTAFCSTWFTWIGGTTPTAAGNGIALTGQDFTAPINFVAAGVTGTAAGDITAISTTLLVTKF